MFLVLDESDPQCLVVRQVEVDLARNLGQEILGGNFFPLSINALRVLFNEFLATAQSPFTSDQFDLVNVALHRAVRREDAHDGRLLESVFSNGLSKFAHLLGGERIFVTRIEK